MEPSQSDIEQSEGGHSSYEQNNQWQNEGGLHFSLKHKKGQFVHADGSMTDRLNKSRG